VTWSLDNSLTVMYAAESLREDRFAFSVNVEGIDHGGCSI
jgi:hypothetical protein